MHNRTRITRSGQVKARRGHGRKGKTRAGALSVFLKYHPHGYVGGHGACCDSCAGGGFCEGCDGDCGPNCDCGKKTQENYDQRTYNRRNRDFAFRSPGYAGKRG